VRRFVVFAFHVPSFYALANHCDDVGACGRVVASCGRARPDVATRFVGLSDAAPLAEFSPHLRIGGRKIVQFPAVADSTATAKIRAALEPSEGKDAFLERAGFFRRPRRRLPQCFDPGGNLSYRRRRQTAPRMGDQDLCE
jgi:hypothetical protein